MKKNCLKFIEYVNSIISFALKEHDIKIDCVYLIFKELGSLSERGREKKTLSELRRKNLDLFSFYLL